MLRTKRALSIVMAASLGMVVSSHGGFAQSVNVETRSAAESQTNVRVQGGQGVEVDTRTNAQSGSRTQVQGAGGGVRVDSGAAAGSQTRVRTDGGGGAAVDTRSQAGTQTRVRTDGAGVSVDSGAAAGSQTRVRTDGGAGTAIDTRSQVGAQTNIRVVDPNSQQPAPVYPYPAQQPAQPLASPAAPPPPMPLAAPDASASVTVGTTVQGTGRPVSCEKTEEITIDDMNIKIVNKSCRGKITGLQAWREGGKTKVQFFFDNKGFSNTTIKMSEVWFDRRGRTVTESIDEQKFAVEAGHNKAVVLTGPIPQAMTAVINFYR